jgi:hypothetical protein
VRYQAALRPDKLVLRVTWITPAAALDPGASMEVSLPHRPLSTAH